MAPTLPQLELIPRAEFRMTVGKISEEYMYTVEKAPEAPNFPIMANVIVIQG